MQSRTIGIVGHGHFGRFTALLIGRFFPDITIKIFSRRETPDQQTFFPLAEVASADVVVLCGSIEEYETQLLSVLPHLGPDTIVVDVATVKKHTTELFRKHATGRLWLSCHPMFGPESYEKREGDVQGFRIVVTGRTLPTEEYEAVKGVFSALGFLIIEMSADEHDRLLAETLFLTHYISQSFTTAGFTRTPIDTVSFQSLMNAVESVAADKKLFQDVYRFNPYCQEAAKRLHEAQEKVFSELLRE